MDGTVLRDAGLNNNYLPTRPVVKGLADHLVDGGSGHAVDEDDSVRGEELLSDGAQPGEVDHEAEWGKVRLHRTDNFIHSCPLSLYLPPGEQMTARRTSL